MSQLHLHVSNRLDLLAAALADTTSSPLASPFTPETVVVQSGAARRWLSSRIAAHNGVCANYEFPFLGTIVARLIAIEAIDTLPPERPEPDLLTWRIESILRRCTSEPEFAAVARYLAGGDALKRFTLAERLAGLFDQYRIYRPDLLLQWTAHGTAALRGNEAWQAKLWLAVEGASEFDRALADLRAHGFSAGVKSKIPERLCVFAPTTLAPAYLDLLFQLGQVCETHLFLLRPTASYYGDDVTPKRRARLGLGDAALEDQPSHPLLASWGRAAADLTDLILETEERLGTADYASEQFAEVVPTNLLTRLQQQIFAAAGTDPAENCTARAVHPEDRSILLNSCHSPVREVEVLYDQLLDCFARDPELRPRDILVLTPEIEKYAPLIRAVFEYPEQEALRIPYAIADRHPRSESVPIDLFLMLLALADTRYTAPDIFLLLSSRALRRRFRLTDDDLALIRTWIDGTGIRWGIDARHREEKGVPPLAANTWRQGLDRLLLGFAMEGKGRQLFADILPYDDVEGDGAGTLGRFLTAAEALFAVETSFTGARPLAVWVEPLLALVTQFFEPLANDEVDAVRHLRVIIGRLREVAPSIVPNETVDFPCVRQFLENQVSTMEHRGSFLSGGVTFCALTPVRGIPAKVISVLGLDSKVFPRRPHQAQFDLMVARRPGDPAPGTDDRLAFLETVLSASQQLLLSYTGRSAQDNEPIPPSVVVSELLDYLGQAFEFPGGQSAGQFLLVEQPLHAFSPRYFEATPADPRLFSYSGANARASREMQRDETALGRPFIVSPLPEDTAEQREIELGELIRFWGNPCQYFVTRRIGFRLGESEQSLAADEPFSLTAWQQYPLKQELLAGKLGFAPAGSLPAFTARGIMPPGVFGELQLRSLDAEVERFAQVVRHHLASSGKQEPRDVNLLLGDFTLSGRLNALQGNGALRFRCANLKPKDQLRAWIEHLALCAADPAGRHQSVLIGTDELFTFQPVDNAAAQLTNLCQLFLAGARLPLPFFPASALAYAAAEFAGKREPLKQAHREWHGQGYGPAKMTGEKADPYVICCFQADASLPAEFTTLAREVCLPLLASAQRQKLAVFSPG